MAIFPATEKKLSPATADEGPIVVHANGRLELEGNRLLSPSAVYHIDIYDDRDHGLEDWSDGDDGRSGEGGSDDGEPVDDRRTNRFTSF